MTSLDFYKKLLVAFLPTGIIGFLLKDKVDELLGSIYIVAAALIAGGIVLVLSDWYLKKDLSPKKNLSELSYKDCIYLGLFQCFSLIPGVSRSGATIIGGLILKYQKKEAAEFSFLLAVPTMAAATLYKSVKLIPTIQKDQILTLSLGSLIAFIVAYLAIKSFISIVTKYGFSSFGYYRIILGLTIYTLF